MADLKKEYTSIAKYVGDWGEGLNKVKLIGNIHKNLMGVNAMGAARPIEDLAYFLLVAKQYDLNPLRNEIYATYQKVKQNDQWLEKIAPIVSIHGLRKLARRSKNPTYAYTGKVVFEEKDGELISATIEVFGRFGNDPTPVKVAEYTAYLEEFVKTKVGKDGNTYRTGNWRTMPRVMLAKCAEANAIRMGFDIGGAYVEEEIDKVGVEEVLKLGDGEEEKC